jgi:hypothetical protein
MMYAMFIDERLVNSSTTRRMIRVDVRAETCEDLLTSLREAMGEPSPKLRDKYVFVSQAERSEGSSRVLSDFALALEQGRGANAVVRSYEAKGFAVNVLPEFTQQLVVIAAHNPVLVGHFEDHLRRLRNLLREPGSFKDKWVVLFCCEPPECGDILPSPAGEAATKSEAGTDDPEATDRVSIGAIAYLRSMWTLLWTAFLHPCTTTVVDLSTGKRLAEISIPFSQWEATLSGSGEESVNG